MGNLLKFLYPPKCPVCRDVLEDDGTYIHPKCRGKFVKFTEPRCFKCGRTLLEAEDDICSECRSKKHSYEYGFCVFEYNDTARLAMVDYKVNGVRKNGDFFAAEAAAELARYIKRIDPEVLVPVPITEKKQGLRGFNQSEYIARQLSEAWDIPMDADILYRTGKEIEQKKLSGREREKITADVFEAVDDMPYRRICIVDDIYTTGSTMEGCTLALRAKGAREVGFVVIFSGGMF